MQRKRTIAFLILSSLCSIALPNVSQAAVPRDCKVIKSGRNLPWPSGEQVLACGRVDSQTANTFWNSLNQFAQNQRVSSVLQGQKPLIYVFANPAQYSNWLTRTGGAPFTPANGEFSFSVYSVNRQLRYSVVLRNSLDGTVNPNIANSARIEALKWVYARTCNTEIQRDGLP